jgi:uncharacterized RDD family membrane protein YckC
VQTADVQGPTGDPTAVVGRRVVAAVVDWLMIAVPTFLVATGTLQYVQDPSPGFCERYIALTDGVCFYFGGEAYFSEGASLIPSAVGFLLGFGLLVVLQGLSGFTPGKLAVGLRTVAEDGSAPGIRKALTRWLLLVVDFLPCLFIVGFVTVLTGLGHRRVGDMAARTFVVRAGAMGAPVQVQPPPVAPPPQLGFEPRHR